MDGRPDAADEPCVSSTANVCYLCCDVFADGVSLLCVQMKKTQREDKKMEDN